jgi:hypothetical protein
VKTRKPKVITLSSPYRLEWVKLALRKPPKPPKGKRDSYLCWVWPRGYAIREWDGKRFLWLSIDGEVLVTDVEYWKRLKP